MSNIALVLIDNQVGFDVPDFWGSEKSNPNYEKNLPTLIEGFRTLRARKGLEPNILHVFHSSRYEHVPLHDSKPDTLAFYPFATPKYGEPTFKKDVNSSFIGTNLEETLRKRGITTIYFAGITVEHCVSTTIRMANNLRITQHTDADGKEQEGRLVLVSDASRSFSRGDFDAETMHKVNATTLKGEFCEVLDTADVLQELSQL